MRQHPAVRRSFDHRLPISREDLNPIRAACREARNTDYDNRPIDGFSIERWSELDPFRYGNVNGPGPMAVGVESAGQALFGQAFSLLLQPTVHRVDEWRENVGRREREETSA